MGIRTALRTRSYTASCKGLAALALLLACLAPNPATATCVGDCGGQGKVGINDLILGVNIALGLTPVSQCAAFANGSGAVDIAQLIAAVANALNGCAATPTVTPGGQTVSVAGTCAAPGNGHRGLKPCDAGTQVTAFRCDDRARCLQQQGLTLLATTTVGDDGAWSLDISMADSSSLLVYQASITNSVVFRTLDFGSLGQGLHTIAGGAAGIGPISLTPASEAAVALLDDSGLETFSDTGADGVLQAVEQATDELSFAGLTPEAAVALAASTASADPGVIAALQAGQSTPTPTPIVGTVVGSGTAASCTEAAFTAALQRGGPISFACGDDPVTVTLHGTRTISVATTIDGGGLVTLSGGGSANFFQINNAVPLTLRNLTLRDGVANGAPGAIANYGILTLDHCAFTHNAAAIYSRGSVDAVASAFTENTAGVIYSDFGTEVTVRDSSVANNGGSGFSSAIHVRGNGRLTVGSSTFANNGAGTAYGGGAIWHGAETATITNSTFVGNYATHGGAIYSDGGSLLAINCTFVGNSATPGNGGAVARGAGAITLINTLLAASPSGGNCAGEIRDGPDFDGHNLDDGTTCGFAGAGCAITGGSSQCNTPALVDPSGLSDHGGPTLTLALQESSSAIGAGYPTVCAAAAVGGVDQRGAPRDADVCSIGAYEALVECAPGSCTDGTPPPLPAVVATVGTGSPASCTFGALSTALDGLAQRGGGRLTFNCGPDAHTIGLIGPKTFATATTIDGGGLVTLSGGGTSNFFQINNAVPVTLANLTLRDGVANGAPGVIANYGVLRLERIAFTTNAAAIYSRGTVDAVASTFAANSAGVIFSDFGSAVKLGDCTVANNSSSGFGSAVHLRGTGTLTVRASTFAHNDAGTAYGGGAIWHGAETATIANSTFVANSGDHGGAVYSDGDSLRVINCTFLDNGAPPGNGGAVARGAGTVTLRNTIVAASDGGNCAGAINDGPNFDGHNLDDGMTCGFTGASCATTSGSSFCNTPTLLDPVGLADHGGPTGTVALTGDSPAVDSGDPAVCADIPVSGVDQRGAPRAADACSIGAYEYGP